jgi:hypothetical protein
MKADPVRTEIAASNIEVGVFPEDAARSDLTCIASARPALHGRGVGVSEGGQ